MKNASLAARCSSRTARTLRDGIAVFIRGDVASLVNASCSRNCPSTALRCVAAVMDMAPVDAPPPSPFPDDAVVLVDWAMTDRFRPVLLRLGLWSDCKSAPSAFGSSKWVDVMVIQMFVLTSPTVPLPWHDNKSRKR
jgi:hypothetical protein